MLKNVRLKNFKLHENTSIEAALINVFIGPNNSGKSSVFQALLALQQAAARQSGHFLQGVQRQNTSPDQPYLFSDHDILDIGEFKDVVRQGEDEIEIGLAVTTYSQRSFIRGDPVEITFDLHVRGNHLVHHTGQLECRFAKFSWEWFAGPPPRSDRVEIQLDGVILHFTPVPNFRLIASAGWTGAAAPERMAELQDFANSLADTCALVCNSMHPISALRGFEEWGYPLPVAPAGSLQMLTLSDRAVAVASILAYNRDLEEQLSRRLEKLLHIGIKVKLVPPKRVTVWATAPRGDGSDTLFVNEGTGVSQLPFILVPIGLTPPNETILLSEPEAHLHPKAQSELTGMLINVARQENIQFFIETHSEHVLHRLLNAVAKGELQRSQLAIYYFENVDGTARVRPLAVNDKGQVDGGLPGFFDQSLAELTEYLDALRKP